MSLKTRREKIRFIRGLTRNVAKDLAERVPEMPKEWDGRELRWLLAEAFKLAAFYPGKTLDEAGGRKRLENFKNDCIIGNLP